MTPEALAPLGIDQLELLHDRQDVGVRRYPGMRKFARVARVQYQHLKRWRLDGPVWVPAPVVSIGEHGGWPLPLMQVWQPTVKAGDGPVPRDWWWPEKTIVCADQTAVCRSYCCSSFEQMWKGIRAGEIPMPSYAIDNHLGWPLEGGGVP